MTDQTNSSGQGADAHEISFGRAIVAFFNPPHGSFAFGLWISLAYGAVMAAVMAVVVWMTAAPVLTALTSDPDWRGWENIDYFEPSPDTLLAVIGAAVLGYLVLLVALWLIQASFFGAILGQQLRSDYVSGLAGMRFGAQMLRLAAVTLLVALMMLPLLLVVLSIALAIGGGLAVVGEATENGALVALGVVFGMLIGLAGLVVVLYVYARLSLAKALTVAHGRFRLMEAWSASRGHGWWLVGAHLVAGMIGYAIAFIVGLFGQIGLFAGAGAAVLALEDFDESALEAQGLGPLLEALPAATYAGFGVYLFAANFGQMIMQGVIVAVSGSFVRDAALAGRIDAPVTG